MVSLPVIENVLSELKILNSEIGHLGLSAGLVGDILSQVANSCLDNQKNSKRKATIFGPYLLGLIIPHGSPLIISTVGKLDLIVTELFVPIFIAISTLQADMSKMFVACASGFTRFNIIIGIVTFLVKVISSFVGSLHCNLPVQGSLALAFLMEQ
ncbi:cation/H(+) antiporter 4-like [Cucumis melo var. makuwa]|uniref:Cation/H(+) antiporter 4-like n=1 Tax=Cucumis melo var. makuwa TaxID=1194695 RepID=A0A5D3BVD2_CUCMM|nr:cation/H(+) antiporter 4-like [Cucumis melo var. makuwa]